VNGGILLVNFRCPDKQNCVGHHVFEWKICKSAKIMFLFFELLCTLWDHSNFSYKVGQINFSTLQTKISLGLSRQKYEKQGGLSEIFDQSVLKSFLLHSVCAKIESSFSVCNF
jgi:hypothetical protein